jgi:uncharacterized membrane protein
MPRLPILTALALILLAVAPASGHKEHRIQREQAAQAEQAALDSAKAHAPMGERTAPARKAPTTATARLLDWLGRLHPVIVHFPIAFFPAALFTALVGRRRPAYAKPVQFLVVAGGAVAPVAALLGWLDGGFVLAADDGLLRFHRWLGTGIGLGGLALALWAARRPADDLGRPMIAALAVMTLAIIVQGWLGGALVHGLDHLDF